MSSFKKASELLNSNNNASIIDELKGKLTYLENTQLSEIHKDTSKLFTKETFDRPCLETLQKYTSSAKQKILKKYTAFNIHENFEFRIVRDTLHTKMIELEEINNGEYNGADKYVLGAHK
ncbi:hypothetical protein C1645_823301 [Glomus cerebriforme]|uniref:Uncharacterized protein n=1 Tax=Glomus cerebriforme TaxID=658196 RepID=A0A397SW95_9GLOM|nr:hypothetical protein C1645_823301 [Glomus cerebriforme]